MTTPVMSNVAGVGEGDGITPDSMVLIPSGGFQMGDHHDGMSSALPVHTVTLDGFYMDRYEVTNQQYADALNWAHAQGGLITVTSGVVCQAGSGTSYPYCDTTTSTSYSRITWNGSTFGVVAGKENHPMVMVSWYGAAAYANWRSAIDGRTPSYDTSTWTCNFAGNGYRLPTEAEWEYAARGGNYNPYYRYPWGDTLDGSKANYWGSGDPYESGGYPWTTPVGYYNGGQTPPGTDMGNGYGLYDMAGNAWEWVYDWYGDYPSGPQTNPRGAGSGQYGPYRVLRGGSWDDGGGHYLRCALRRDGGPGSPGDAYGSGFRLVLDSWAVLPNSQPQAGDDQPGNKVALDHLWQWSDQDGRFVDPSPAGVTIDSTKPTYLLTHGWDGDLNAKRSMSSIGCAIRAAKGDSVNLIAWDWAREANPNGRDDLGVLLANGNVQLLEKLGAFFAGRLLVNTLTSAYFFGIGDAVTDALISGVNARYQGIVLGRALARELERPGGSLGTELHFIGKSHGGGLLGQAARILKLKHPVTSLTTLDTPHVLCDGTGCLIDSLAYVDPSAALHTAVFYYSERVADILVRYVAGLGAPVGPDHSRLTNVALNPFLVPWKWPVQILHLWISGPDGGVDGACPPEDGWFPLNTWNHQTNESQPLRFLPAPSPPVAYSLLNVPDFPAGSWEERDPYTFVSLNMGACCTDSFWPCSEKPEVDCIASGGQYKGNGTTCVDSDSQGGPDICETTPPPTGACCNSLFPTGPFWCDQRTRSWCAGPGFYTYYGDGTQCDTNGDGLPDICGTLAATARAESTPPVPSPAPGMSLLRYEPFQSAATWFGNLTQLVIGADPDDATNRVILMQEQGDASFFKDIAWASDAVVITFDYMFREPRGGENLTVYVDNQILYYDNAEISLARDHLTGSGAIYVGNVAGLTKRLNFVFRTDVPDGGTLGGELVIDNIRVYGFLEADADLDGDRDLADFAVMQRCFGASPMPDECWSFDVNGDNAVDLIDYSGDAADPPQFAGFVQFIGDANTGGPRIAPAP